MSGKASSISVVKLYAPREKIYTRAAPGRYAAWRTICVWLTQVVYYGLPWLQWNGRPAVLFDLGTRKFHVFGTVLWPQDLIFLAGFLILCACLMFFLSALAGRVWCSFACPHTVYTEIFMWIERLVEGSRSARMQLDRQPVTLLKIRKKILKHAAWIVLALWTGITLVGYFTPIRTLLGDIARMTLGPWQIFWIASYAVLTYLNAGWSREQICKYLCVYARFQSVMFNPDTLIITYDQSRGEPRGPRRKQRNPQALQQGDCVDCTICIQACPVGIDIRNGLQYECIDCAACIDACDAVMDKLGMQRGLIRYAAEHGKDGLSARHPWRHLLRLRVLGYAGVLAVGIALYVTTLSMRAPLKLNVALERDTVGRKIEGGALENAYRLHIINSDERPHRYLLTVAGIETISLAGEAEVSVGGISSRVLPVRVRVDAGHGIAGANRIRFELEELDGGAVRISEPAVFPVR